jgi:hypothetical protein
MTTNPTDTREAIKAAFGELRRRGYFCRSNFWCCQTCALAAVPEGRGEQYVFYHRQDARDLDREGACYLSWGGDGSEIAEALRGAGLAVEWDGTDAQRMWVRLA